MVVDAKSEVNDLIQNKMLTVKYLQVLKTNKRKEGSSQFNCNKKTKT